MSAKNKPKRPASNDIRITRVYNAPVKAVWDAWTDPTVVRRWWGSDPDGVARRITADTASYLGPLRAAASEAMNRFLDLVAARAA